MSSGEPAERSNHVLGSGSTDTSPVDSTPNTKVSSRKRLASVSGSRSTSSLRPDQLAKKRANDREAQRAIRERTKHHIENLEREIRELKSQQPYQELERIVRLKEAVEAELEDLKRRLATAFQIIQPLVAGYELGLQEPLHPTKRVKTEDSSPRAAALYQGPSALVSPVPCSGFSTQHNGISAAPQAAWIPSGATLPPISAPLIAPLTTPPISDNVLERQRTLALTIAAERPVYNAYTNARQDVPCIRQRDGPPLPADSHITLSASLSDSSMRQQNHGFDDGSLAISTRLPPNTSSTCPLDGLLLDFLADRRQRSVEGMPIAELIGPSYPSFHCLFRPERARFSHPLSRFFTDILATFPDLSTPPEQVAILFVMFLIMRWQISPNQENYDRLPDWVKPTTAQLHNPHPAWIDHLPWPRLREKLISHYHCFPFDDFFIPYTTTVSLNWPYGPMDTLVSTPKAEELSINPIFEKHLRDLQNWSLGAAFVKEHPELAETTVEILPITSTINHAIFVAKLDLIPGVLQGLGAALYAALQGPFRGGSDAFTYNNHVMFAICRTLFTRLSPAQLQFMMGSSKDNYLKFAKAKGFEPNVVAIPHGTDAFWIGSPAAGRIVVWFHGGGFAMPLNDGAMTLAAELKDLFSTRDHEAALFLPSYTSAPDGQYPLQLTQTVEAFRYLTEDLGKQSCNIIVGGDSAGGDSAGGGLALGLMSHILHPILRYKDVASASYMTPWKNNLLNGRPVDNYNSPATAPAEWWTGLMLEDVLIVAGGDEAPVDDVEMVGNNVKRAYSKTTMVIVPHGFHIEPILAPLLGMKEGEQAEAMKAWVKARASM
ncbi:hypothetical protein MMC13_001307 [Lambiella insularis]|nr:hypothetical protein [Lambiella insularis]